MTSDRTMTGNTRQYTTWLLAGLVVLMGIVAYANSFAVPMQFDDDVAVRISTDFKVELFSMSGFFRKSRWLADATFAFNRILHGEEPFGFHLVNLLIHLCTALLVFQLLKLMLDALFRTASLDTADEGALSFLYHFIPCAVAAFFVCHPVQSQAITYIVQRYTALATLWYVAALCGYLRARLTMEQSRGVMPVALWSGVALVAALLALKSKEIAGTLPLMAMLFELVLFQGRLLKKPLFVLVCLALLAVIPLQMVFLSGTENGFFIALQSASAETAAISRSDYLLTQCRVIATYLRLLLLPIRQNLDYDYPLSHSLLELPVLAGALLHLLLNVGALWLIIKAPRSTFFTSPVTRLLLRLAGLGILWFYLALTVESSLIPISDVIFEHRIYLPSVGFFMALVALLAAAVWEVPRWRRVVCVAVLMICIVLTAATVLRNRKWSDRLQLWEDVLEKSPNKARPQHTVGFIYVKRNQPEKALPHLVRAIELDHGMDRYWATLNAAIAQMDKFKGRSSMGLEYLTAINVVNPKYITQWAAISNNNLGLAYEHLGNLYRAMESFQRGVVLDLQLQIGWYNLAICAAHRGEQSAMEHSLKRLHRINPGLADAAESRIAELRRSGGI